MTLQETHSERGFTLPELLVSLMMFALIGMGFVSFVTSAFQTVAVESRASLAAQELKNGLMLLGTELRMSSSLSPYIVGISQPAVTCSGALTVSANSTRFLVVQDDSAATTAGIQPYYVGYRYDATNRRLLRGEIAGNTITNCTMPAGDPTASNIATILAENVVRIDTNGDGTDEPVFASDGNSILVSLGIEVDGPNSRSIVQPMPMRIYRRRT